MVCAANPWVKALGCALGRVVPFRVESRPESQQNCWANRHAPISARLLGLGTFDPEVAQVQQVRETVPSADLGPENFRCTL